MPVIAYLADNFQKPIPFQPDVVVGIDAVVERKLDMIHCHASQFYEWLPYNQRIEHQVPRGEQARREWLRRWRFKADQACADKYRKKLIELYGRRKGSKIRHAEAFEGCEYGAPLNKEAIARLFPFVGKL